MLLALVSNPLFHALLLTAYITGLLNPEQWGAERRRAAVLWDLLFLAGVGIAAAMFARHGAIFGGAAVLLAWGGSIIGARRGVIVERNALLDSLLWTTHLPHARRPVGFAATPPGIRRPRTRRPIAAPAGRGRFRLPEVVAGRGRRLTIMGVAMDLAACVVIFAGLSMWLR